MTRHPPAIYHSDEVQRRGAQHLAITVVTRVQRQRGQAQLATADGLAHVRSTNTAQPPQARLALAHVITARRRPGERDPFISQLLEAFDIPQARPLMS